MTTTESEPQSNKLTKGGKIGAIIFIIAFIVIFGSCMNWLCSEPTETNIPSSTPISYPTVRYEVGGSARWVDVTLNNSTGGTEQYGNVSTPSHWAYSSFSDSFLYISAQNQGEYGTVRVSIFVDDVEVKRATSSGAYVIATASCRR